MLSRDHSDCAKPWEMQRALLAAEGYLTLGMFREALDSLDEAEAHCDLNDPSVLQMRIRVLLRMRRWKEAERISRLAARAYVDEEEFKVQRAFALRQMQKDEQAMNVLLSLPPWMICCGLAHYNLACYEARLGDREVAVRCIRAAIGINSAFKKAARVDPDLADLWS
jgi:tetratricopeptide (TPR) repeat protein